MIKPFINSMERVFSSNALGLEVYRRKGSDKERFLAARHKGFPSIEIWLQFPPKKDEFSLFLVEPPDSNERADLFRYRPLSSSEPDGFWIEARFLPCFENASSLQFAVPEPTFSDLASILCDLKVSIEEACRRLECSSEKLGKLASGYYQENVLEGKNVRMRGLPTWAVLDRVATIPEHVAYRQGILVEHAVHVLQTHGLDQFVRLRDDAVRAHRVSS